MAFGVKVLAGMAYGYIFLHYFGGDDTWYFHQQGLYEKNLLLTNPRSFFSDFNPALPFLRNDTFSAGFRNLLSDWEYFLLLKPFAFINMLSGGNYFINIVFFSFITFWGHYWFFELLVKIFPDQRRTWFLLVFFFPPVVFWLSGLRGDPLLFFFISLTLNKGYDWMKTSRKRSLVWALVGLAGAFVMRDPVAILLCPALLCVFLTVKYRVKPWKVWVPVYAIGIVFFFATAWLSPSKSLPQMIVNKQTEFFALKGNTIFKLDTLQPGVASFAAVFPQAVTNTFFKPMPWEAKGPLQLIAALDILFFWTLVLIACFRDRESWRIRFSHPLLLLLVVFSVGAYIFTGYTVPFPGAIVRYKIIPELFFFTWILYTNRKKLDI